jgi:hypothetical protein
MRKASHIFIQMIFCFFVFFLLFTPCAARKHAKKQNENFHFLVIQPQKLAVVCHKKLCWRIKKSKEGLTQREDLMEMDKMECC